MTTRTTDWTRQEEKQPEESTLVEDVLESQALDAPDTLPEAPSEPDSRASESLASHSREASMFDHVRASSRDGF